MTRWEYRFEVLELDDLDVNAAELNRLGEEGWEVVSLLQRGQAATTLTVVLLKRQKA